MEVLMAALLIALLLIAVPYWGVDSRPADADRATRWWAGTPRS